MAGLPEAEETPPFSWNLSERAPDEFLSRLYLPQDDGSILSGDPGNIDWLRAKYGRDAHVTDCSRRAVLAAIERQFRAAFRERAISELAACEPQFSASVVITRAQVVVFATIAFLGVWMLAAAPQSAGVALTAVFGVLFLANGMFRALLLWAAGRAAGPSGSSAEDFTLPAYSILVPLYREANVMPALLRALRALDYPGLLAQLPQEI